MGVLDACRRTTHTRPHNRPGVQDSYDTSHAIRPSQLVPVAYFYSLFALSDGESGRAVGHDTVEDRGKHGVSGDVTARVAPLYPARVTPLYPARRAF